MEYYEDKTEIEFMLGQLERSIITYEGIDDLYVNSLTALDTSGITGSGLTMLQNAISIHTQGVDIDVPTFALEGLTDTEIHDAAVIVLENFSKVVKAAWDRVVDMVSKFLNYVSNAWKTRTRDLEYIKENVSGTLLWLSQAKNVTPVESTLVLSLEGARKTTVGGKYDPISGLKVVSNLIASKTMDKAVGREMKEVLGKYKSRSLKDVKTARKSFGAEGELMNADVDGYIASLRRMGFTELDDDSRFRALDTVYWRSPSLPGDDMIVCAIKSMEVPGTSQRQINTVRYNQAQIDPSQVFEVTVPAMDVSELTTLCKTILTVVKRGMEFKSSIADSEALMKAYLKEGNRLVKEMNKLSDADRRELGETYSKARVLTTNILKISTVLFEPQQTLNTRLAPTLKVYQSFVTKQRKNLKIQ